MTAQIKIIGEKALVESIEALYRCKDIQKAVDIANIKGYSIVNKNDLPEYFSKQLKY